MEENTTTVRVGDFIFRQRAPEGEGPHPVMLLVHGLTGDENVMWIFTPRLDPRYLILAPRAPYPSGQSGYSWETDDRGYRLAVDGLQPAIAQLLEILKPEYFPSADFSKMFAMGFSQGAALVYTLGLTHPEKLQAFAGLAGFIPENAKSLAASRPLEGKPVFIAHGTRDETVPIERARQAVEVLQLAGAEVTYCEEEAGHKLSAGCFRAMDKFFRYPA